MQTPRPDICPRCGHPSLNPEKVMNALSRRDNETYICSSCGTSEAVNDWQGITDTDKWRFPPQTISQLNPNTNPNNS